MSYNLTRSIAQSLRYVLIDSADFKTPKTGYAFSGVACKHQKQGAATLTTKTLSGSNFRHVGEGIYEVDFTAGELDTLGSFTTQMKANDSLALPYYREDQIIVAGTAANVGFVATLHTQTGAAVTIPSVTIQVRDSAGTTVIAEGVTDASTGNLSVLLPAGTYKVYAWKAGYTFSGSPFTVVVSADATTNLTGAAFAPSNPGGPNLVTVYGWLLDATGAARVGIVVTFQPILESQNVRRTFGIDPVTKLLSRYAKTVTTDANGYFELALTPNASISPTGTQYHVLFADAPQDNSIVTVPITGPVNIHSLQT